MIFKTLILWLCLSGFRTQKPNRYYCVDDKYCRREYINDSIGISFGACRLTCGTAQTLWPYPTGIINISKNLTLFYLDNKFEIKFINNDSMAFIDDHVEYLNEVLSNGLLNTADQQYSFLDDGKKVIVYVNISEKKPYQFQTNEAYELFSETQDDGVISVTIKSNSYNGFKNGFITLTQMIVYDDINKKFTMPNYFYIEDKPSYSYRGVLIDVARNYIPTETLIEIITILGLNKLNTLHLHLTDTQSFPYFSAKYPDLALYGAYADDKVYSSKDISAMKKAAASFGIEIIHEFGFPAHMGAGWSDFDDVEPLVDCFDEKPFQLYCKEPPCGQINPLNSRTLEILTDLHLEVINKLNSSSIHLGGNDLNYNCWNKSHALLQKNDEPSLDEFYKFWSNSMNTIRNNLLSYRNLTMITYSSELTSTNDSVLYLHPSNYVLQMMTKNVEEVKKALEHGYRIILSNYSIFRWDCGFGSWTANGFVDPECTQYNEWQDVYNYDIQSLFDTKPSSRSQILGAEGILWSQQVSSYTIQQKLFPRAYALAERLWSDFVVTDHIDAFERLHWHAQKLYAFGAKSQGIQPYWCLQMMGRCLNGQ